jgi:hypothetical protein
MTANKLIILFEQQRQEAGLASVWIAAQPAADRQYFRLRRAVFMPFFAYFPPQTSNFNAFQKAFNFGAKQKGRAWRKEELSGFHLRLSHCPSLMLFCNVTHYTMNYLLDLAAGGCTT